MSIHLRPSLIRDSLIHMSSPQHRETVAAEVRAALARDGRKAAALAEATGISRTSLSRKLRGLTPFYVEELIAIASALDVDAGALITAAYEGTTLAA